MKTTERVLAVLSAPFVFAFVVASYVPASFVIGCVMVGLGIAG